MRHLSVLPLIVGWTLYVADSVLWFSNTNMECISCFQAIYLTPEAAIIFSALMMSRKPVDPGLSELILLFGITTIIVHS